MSNPAGRPEPEASHVPADNGFVEESDDPALTDLLADCDEKLAAGSEPTTNLITEGESASLPPRLQKGLACLRLLDRLRPRHTVDSENSAVQARSNDSSWRHGDPTRIGRFQIRRKLGHGGFGVVYLAYDPKLRRQVALKVPHPRTILTRELRERFQLEAAAAAGLDHPNVVPVFDSGETGPICYIASAYCPGISLGAWLRGQTEPVPSQSAAALVAQIADGVQHAHERGILHRDLKPGNVLLTPLRVGKLMDESSTLEPSVALASDALDFLPRITDFGMAKRVGEWESDGGINEDPAAPLTKTGAVMGTPSYMAPEQAAGRNTEIGPPTDVHGLGVILYEILTAQTPFFAESTFDTLRRVQHDEPLPPRRLRPKVPRDLETICLRCLQKDPRRRYQAAGELADDLRRFLDGKSIRARSVGPMERTWRWSRRKPVVAGLLLALVLVIFSAIGGLSFLFLDARGKAELARQGESAAKLASEAEKAARAKAEEHLHQVHSLMDNLTNITRSLSVNDPAQRRLKRNLLEDLLNFHEIFVTEKGDDPAVLYESAMAYQNIGHLRVELGRVDPAQEAFERARELFLTIEKLDPKTPRYRLSRAWGCYWYGYLLLRRKGLIKEAVPLYEEGIRIMEGLLAESPDNINYMGAMAVISLNWASTQVNLRKPEKAEAAYPKVIALLRRAIKAAPKAQGYRSDLAVSLNSWAALLIGKRFKLDGKAMTELVCGMGSLATMLACWNNAVASQQLGEEARANIVEALALMNTLVRESPNQLGFRYTLTRVKNQYALLLSRSKAQQAAYAQWRESVANMKKVVASNTDSLDYRFMLVETAMTLARELPSADRKEAIELLYLCLDHAEKLVAQFPDSRWYKNRQAQTLYMLINRLLPDRLPEGIAYLESLVKRQPNHGIAVSELSWFLATRQGVTLVDRMRALDLVRQAIAKPLVTIDRLHREGVDLYRQDKFPTAKTVFEKCIKDRANPIADDYFYLAMTCWKLGERDQAREHYSTALRLVNTLANTPATLGQLRSEVEKLLASRPKG